MANNDKNINKVGWIGLIISSILFFAGMKYIIFKEAVGGRIGGSFYKETDICAIILGIFFLAFSSFLFFLYNKSLKIFIKSNNILFETKKINELLIAFYSFTPICLYIIKYINITICYKKILFIYVSAF